MKDILILLVDDDDDLRRAIKAILNSNNYQVIQAATGSEALKHYQEVDLVILDVMLPEIDGFELCQKIRQKSAVPIILLTAKGDIVDKKIGFSFGADDYLVKPFNMDELLLRINALIRRSIISKSEDDLSSTSDKERIVAGELQLDHLGRKTIVRGAEVYLTATEFDLLWTLANSPGRVFTRKQLFDSVWGENGEEVPRTITVLIRRIREKIEPDPAHPVYVLTVWGVGYKFAENKGL